MTRTLEGVIRIAVDVKFSEDVGIAGNTLLQTLSLGKTHSLTPGACDTLFHDDGSIADAEDVEIDLLADLDVKGDALNLESVMGIVVVNTTAAGEEAASLVLGGAAPNGWTAIFGGTNDTLTIPPNTGEVFPCVGGLDVDATHNMLKLAHDGTGDAACTYQIVIMGKRAT